MNHDAANHHALNRLMIQNAAIPLLFGNWLPMLQVRLPWVLLGVGFLVLSVALVVLMLSRLGHARPLAKCVVLSVYAHFLLLGYAYMINLFNDAGHGGYGPGLAITLLTEPVETDDQSEDWQRSKPLEEPSERLPELERHPIQVETPPPERPVQPALDNNINLEGLEIPPLLDAPPLTAVDLTTAAPVAAAGITKPLLERRRREHQAIDVDTPTPPRTAMETAVETAKPSGRITNTDIQSLADVEVNADQGEIVAAETDRTHAIFTSARDATDKTHRSTIAASQIKAEHLPRLYQVRAHPNRLQQVIEQGGSRDTERAVRDALAWMARAQEQDGRWSTRAWGGGQETRDFSNVHGTSSGIHADTALTGLALLSFFGAGFTHLDGPYKETINDGLEFLYRRQSSSTGNMAGQAGRFVAMYCHGIATLALSEAYALTRDERIRPHLEQAIGFTVRSQNTTTGGWRYVPGDTGDMSQFGWQIMSLLSARTAGIEIPNRTWARANRFLQRVSLGQNGGLACYTPNRPVASHSMTAEALMCRIFLQGSRSEIAIEEGADFVARHGLGTEPMNLYYFYYATISLHQLQDHRWVSWNRALTNKLLDSQQTEGDVAGSWSTDTVWGRAGGRVYTTALATLCLECYYRYLPIYKSHIVTATRHSVGQSLRD